MINIANDEARSKLYESVKNKWIERAKAQQFTGEDCLSKEVEFMMGFATAIDMIMEADEKSFISPRLFVSIIRSESYSGYTPEDPERKLPVNMEAEAINFIDDQGLAEEFDEYMAGL